MHTKLCHSNQAKPICWLKRVSTGHFIDMGMVTTYKPYRIFSMRMTMVLKQKVKYIII